MVNVRDIKDFVQLLDAVGFRKWPQPGSYSIKSAVAEFDAWASRSGLPYKYRAILLPLVLDGTEAQVFKDTYIDAVGLSHPDYLAADAPAGRPSSLATLPTATSSVDQLALVAETESKASSKYPLTYERLRNIMIRERAPEAERVASIWAGLTQQPGTCTWAWLETLTETWANHKEDLPTSAMPPAEKFLMGLVDQHARVVLQGVATYDLSRLREHMRKFYAGDHTAGRCSCRQRTVTRGQDNNNSRTVSKGKTGKADTKTRTVTKTKEWPTQKPCKFCADEAHNAMTCPSRCKLAECLKLANPHSDARCFVKHPELKKKSFR